MRCVSVPPASFPYRFVVDFSHTQSALLIQVEVAKYAPYVQRKVYLFHRVFSESTQQRQLYRQAVRPLILKALEGYNFTCFAYGQTGTGKTFTLTGDLSSSTGASDGGSAPIHELVRAFCGPSPRPYHPHPSTLSVVWR